MKFSTQIFQTSENLVTERRSMLPRLSHKLRNRILSRSINCRSFAGQSKRIEVTPTTLRQSRDKMLDYYVNLQQPSGQMKGYEDCAYYCKLPLGLLLGGRVDEADRMLTFCRNQFLTPIGDFMNDNTMTTFDPDAKTLFYSTIYCIPQSILLFTYFARRRKFRVYFDFYKVTLGTLFLSFILRYIVQVDSSFSVYSD